MAKRAKDLSGKLAGEPKPASGWLDQVGVEQPEPAEEKDSARAGVYRRKTFLITDPATPLDYPMWLYDLCTTDYPCMEFTGNVWGQLSYEFAHDSLPFRGAVDELQIFRQVLDADSVRSLYDSLNLALHLKLDEAPGETWFADSGAGRRNGGDP